MDRETLYKRAIFMAESVANLQKEISQKYQDLQRLNRNLEYLKSDYRKPSYQISVDSKDDILFDLDFNIKQLQEINDNRIKAIKAEIVELKNKIIDFLPET